MADRLEATGIPYQLDVIPATKHTAPHLDQVWSATIGPLVVVVSACSAGRWYDGSVSGGAALTDLPPRSTLDRSARRDSMKHLPVRP
jgi:hypothetical protein